MPYSASGPKDAKIMIVGEAPGQQEEMTGQFFIGQSGQELTRMLLDAGIKRGDCYITNVFWERPPGNKLDTFCAKKAEVGKDYHLPPIAAGKYVKNEYLHHLDRLADEIRSVQPNIIIPMGNVASWAILQQTKITTIRGTLSECTLVPGIKVLPTFHPAAVLRQWSYRSVVVADLQKAAREMEYPEIRRVVRHIHVPDSIQDIRDWLDEYGVLQCPDPLAFDIETHKRQMTCIGFAHTKDNILVIPFFMPPNDNHWNFADECAALKLVHDILQSRRPKLAQNGLYDIQYLWKEYGTPVRNYLHDTMLLHHSLQPEMQKGLGFMGSVYTDELGWKDLRKAAQIKETKRDE